MCNFSVILFNNYKQTLFFYSFFPCIHNWIIIFVFVSVSIANFQLGGGRCTHTWTHSHTLIVFVLRSSSCRVCVCVWCMCMWVYEFLTLCVCVCVCDAAVKACCVKLLRKPAEPATRVLPIVPGKEMLACEGRLPRRPKRKVYCFCFWRFFLLNVANCVFANICFVCCSCCVINSKENS